MQPTNLATETPSSPPTTPVIVLANHKGGCGKTTTAANLGAAFAERGHTALIIDTDPQANLSETFGIDRQLAGPRLEDALDDPQTPATPWPLDHLDDPLFTRRGGRLDVLPCTARLEQVVTERGSESGFPRRLRQITNALKPAYDVIVIDTQPGLGPLSSMAMLAGDWIIVPARPADLDIGGAVKLTDLVNHELRPAHPGLQVLGVLLTQADRRWTLTQDSYRALAVAELKRLRVDIPFMVRTGAAPRYGAPTLVLSPDNKVSCAYRQLADELTGVLLPGDA